MQQLKTQLGILVLSAFCASAASAATTFAFGDDWTVGPQCKVKDPTKPSEPAKSYALKYTGSDIAVDKAILASKGYSVKVLADVYYNGTQRDVFGGKDMVTACQKVETVTVNTKSVTRCVNDSTNVFYEFANIKTSKETRALKRGVTLKNVVLGELSKKFDKNVDPHLFIAKRTGVFNAALMYARALPPAECSKRPWNFLPTFPEKFTSPDKTMVSVTPLP